MAKLPKVAEWLKQVAAYEKSFLNFLLLFWYQAHLPDVILSVKIKRAYFSALKYILVTRAQKF